MHFNTVRKTKLQNSYHCKYEIKGKLHGNMLILKEAGNPMKYYGKKKKKRENITKQIKQQLFNVFYTSCHYKMIHFIDTL